MKKTFFILTVMTLTNLGIASEMITVEGTAFGVCKDSNLELLIKARLDAVKNAGPYFIQVGQWKERIKEYQSYGVCRSLGKQAFVESEFKRR